MHKASLTLAALCALHSASGFAQAYQCRIPSQIEQSAPPRPDGPARQTPLGGFTLAASWSPEFCHGARDQAASLQCSGRAGRFGFVLHGLWPEAPSGPAPQWCSLTPRPTAQELRAQLCMTPSPGLLEHEWAKHGSCMAKTPAAYFAMARAAWDRIEWPDADALSRRSDLRTGDLRGALLAANPGWRADQVSIQLTPSGWLREVQLCFAANRKPATCPRYRRGAADRQPLKIWRGF